MLSRHIEGSRAIPTFSSFLAANDQFMSGRSRASVHRLTHAYYREERRGGFGGRGGGIALFWANSGLIDVPFPSSLSLNITVSEIPCTTTEKLIHPQPRN